VIGAHAIGDDEAVAIVQLARLSRRFDEQPPLGANLVCRRGAVQQGAHAAAVGAHAALTKRTISLIAEARNIEQEFAFARSHFGERIGIAVGEKLPFLRQRLHQRLDPRTLASDRCRQRAGGGWR